MNAAVAWDFIFLQKIVLKDESGDNTWSPVIHCCLYDKSQIKSHVQITILSEN